MPKVPLHHSTYLPWKWVWIAKLVRYAMQWTPTMNGLCLLMSYTITPTLAPEVWTLHPPQM